MKIALICPEYLPCPPVHGGAIELLIDRVAPHLSKLGYTVTIYSIQDSSLHKVDILNYATFIRFPRKGYLKEVMRDMKQKQYDLIQVYNKPEWVSPLKETFPKYRVVLSLHNLIIGSRIDDQVSKKALANADHIVTVSQFVADDILSRYPFTSGKITPLYTGEDPDRYIPHYSIKGRLLTKQVKSKLGIPKDFKTILFVGRLQPKKGCHYVIEAMRAIMEKHPKTAFVIVGSANYGNLKETEYIQSLKELAQKTSGHIYFTSFIPAGRISDYYTMSDILVCPSQWKEPLARVQYEAMAAGIPIVTTDRGGNGEVIKHGKNGYVLTHYNKPKAFADAIGALLKNTELREKMGLANRELIEKKYNIKQYSRNISKVYRKITDSR